MKRIAAIQMASGPNVQANLLEAERLIARAAQQKAGLVVLPENFALMGAAEEDKVHIRESEGNGPIQDFLAAQAKRHRLWLVGGTIPMVASSPERVRASCLVYDDDGVLRARYDKMHLFDVHLDEGRETYFESQTIEAGNQLGVIDTPYGRLGLAVCYDLRFPEMFRNMVAQGMEVCAVPSAFTAVTGRAHWRVLVRARAIENLCYVVAAGQGGFHRNGRETYGHSLIVDPWGVVLDKIKQGPGLVVADIDPARARKLRRSFPVIDHMRLVCNVA